MLRSIAASTISMSRRPMEARGRKRFSAKPCAASLVTAISSPPKSANTQTQTVMAATALDYSRARIRASLDESAGRLGVEYFDIIHIHDIEYQDRKHTEWALTEGYDAVQELKREGRIGNVSFGIYPMDLWKRIFASFDIDAALVHNHYCLNDTQLLDLLPVAKQKDIGIVNGSPFASGLLTDRGPAAWHPASAEDRSLFQVAAEFCRSQGTSISRLALQFSSQNPEIPTTLFSTSKPETVRSNVESHEEPYDTNLVAEVQKILKPVLDKEWSY